MATPPKQCKHGSYLARRGFAVKHVGQIGREQQRVLKTSRPGDEGEEKAEEAGDLTGGNDDEQARHRAELSIDMLTVNLLNKQSPA
jgi:hypothetical protein